MTLVAITALRLFDAEREEWRSALDERWFAFLRRCDLLPLLLPNDAESAARLLETLRPAGVVLSGGGEGTTLSGRVDARDRTELAALDWAERHGKPVLGVCRGLQVLLGAAGVALQPVAGHIRARHGLHTAAGRREVNSYHGYGCHAAPGFEVLGRADDDSVEWVRDPARQRHGVM